MQYVLLSCSINQFVIEAGNAETFDQTSSVSEALEQLGLPNMYEPLPGMNVALMAHQAIGVAWMLEKERQVTRRGGILADEMGLGKVRGTGALYSAYYVEDLMVLPFCECRPSR